MPARFRFRLEPLLRLRKSFEQEAQRHLAREIDARNAVEKEMKALQDKYKETIESRRCEPGEPIDILRWANLERFLVVLEKRIIRAGEMLREAEGRVLKARQDLAKAHRDHLTLLRLKERRQAEHDRETLQQEIREGDELAVLRYRFASPGTVDMESPGGVL